MESGGAREVRKVGRCRDTRSGRVDHTGRLQWLELAGAHPPTMSCLLIIERWVWPNGVQVMMMMDEMMRFDRLLHAHPPSEMMRFSPPSKLGKKAWIHSHSKSPKAMVMSCEIYFLLTGLWVMGKETGSWQSASQSPCESRF